VGLGGGQTVRVAGEAKEGSLESGGGRLVFERGGSVECDEAAVLEDGDAAGEEFDFSERMRGEEERSFAVLQDLGFEEMAEGCGGDGVEAASGLVEEEDPRRVKEGTGEAEALDGARR